MKRLLLVLAMTLAACQDGAFPSGPSRPSANQDATCHAYITLRWEASDGTPLEWPVYFEFTPCPSQAWLDSYGFVRVPNPIWSR